MLKTTVKDPHQSIGQRAQRLVMRLSPQTKGTIVMSLRGGLVIDRLSTGPGERPVQS